MFASSGIAALIYGYMLSSIVQSAHRENEIPMPSILCTPAVPDPTVRALFVFRYGVLVGGIRSYPGKLCQQQAAVWLHPMH